MKTKFIALFALLITGSISAQNLLNNQWKFTTGDDPSWTRPEVDDSHWANANIGEVWENWGYKNYDGFGWYRKQVVIPSSLKKQAEKNGGFSLKLARIDDVDFTYFNGALVGQTGDVPPHFQGKYDVERNYTIPTSLILWDKPNTIAVRVFDYSGGGGIYGDNISLSVRGTNDMMSIQPAMKEADRVIKGVSVYKLPIEIKNDANNKLEGKLKVYVLNDFKDTFAIKEQTMKIASKSQKIAYVELKGLKPSLYLVKALFETADANKSIRFNFAVDLEKMVSQPDPQPDFVNYWDRAKRELAAVDPQYKLIPVDSFSTPTKTCYTVEMRSLGNVLIRAWYMVPKKPGKYPAILTVQGYSSYLIPTWTYQGDDVICMGLNVRGHGNSKDNVNPGFPGYLYSQIQDKEQYIYRGAYMDCVRAIDFLFSRAEVDTNRVAVEGGSQGGALSFATAALNGNRIKAAVPAVPFLSDFRDYVRVANWPTNEWAEYVKNNPQVGWEGIFKTMSYIDIKNLAPWITAPVFMAVGIMDETCPIRINFAAYNNLKGEKKYIAYPNSGHGLPGEFNELKYQYLKEKLGVK
jgi:cephalosporin-C deacetylase